MAEVPAEGAADAPTVGAPGEGTSDASATGAVAASIEKKSDMSYYHAHRGPKDDLSSAQKLHGPGLCKPDGMEAVDPSDPRYHESAIPKKRIHLLKKYMFEDAGSAVKVHVELEDAEILKMGELKVEYEENGKGMEASIECEKDVYKWVVQDQPFHAPIVPEKCKHRISSDKKRIVFTLVKKNPDESWYQLLEKHISKATGWE